MRRALSLLLTLTLALAIAGCTKPKPEEPPKPTYKGNLVLWAAPGLAGSPVTKPEAGWFQEQAKAFETANPGITVTVRMFESPAALEKAVAEGTEPAPDIAFGRMVPEAGPRLAELLPNEIMDRWHPAAYGFVQGPHLRGYPMLMEVQALALNEAAFAAAGVALPENGKWTQAELENKLRGLSANSRFGLGFYAIPGYHEWWPLLSGLVMPDATTAPGAEAGLATLARYRKEGWLHPDTGKIKAEETWALFAQGKIAVMPVSSWAIPLLRQAPYNVKLSVAGFPGDVTVGSTYGFMLFRQNEQAKLLAASALGTFMAAPDQQTRLARETGLVPVSKMAGNPFEGDAQLTRIYQLAATQRSLPAGPGWDKAEAAFFRPLLLAMLGEKEPKDALAIMQQQIHSAMTPASK